MSSQGADAVTDRLCIALYHAGHAMNAAYRDLLGPLGLTYPQYSLLSVLWLEGPRTVSALAHALGVKSSTVSPLVKRLEASGWVERQRDRDDERSVVVHLSPAGRRLSTRTRDVQARISRAAGLSEQQQTRLVNQLQTVTDHLRGFGSD